MEKYNYIRTPRGKRLLPCPVCGYKKPFIEPRKVSEQSPITYGIKCPRYACPTKYTLYYQDINKAINEWNKRPRDGERGLGV